MIGVVDKDKQYNQRYSCESGNAITYSGLNGYICYGDENGKCQCKQEGNGFGKINDIVRM